MAEQLLVNVNVSGEGDLDKLDKSMGGVAKSTKKAADEISIIRKQIKEAKSEMLKYNEGTKEYNAALAKAGQLQFRLKDINDKTRASVRDFGQTAKNVSQSISGMAGVFGVVQGSMALFGVENEATLKTLQNLTAGLSIVQGMASFADSIDSMRDLYAGLKASGQAAAGTAGAVTELSAIADKNANSLGNVAKESAVLGSNLAGAGVQTDNMNKAVANSTASIKQYTKAEFDAMNLTQQRNAKMNQMIINTQAQKTSTDAAAKSTENLGKATEKAGTSIGKTMLTMGLITLAIGLVIFAISKLIEWMNKIPETLSVKIDLNSESLKKVESDYNKLRLFAIDYNKASRNGDKEKLKYLEDIAKKEYGINKNRLESIKTNLNSWRESFKEYLKIAKDTYFNEALAKKKSEIEVSSIIAYQNIKDIKEQLRNIKGGDMYDDIKIVKLKSMLEDERQKNLKNIKEMNVLNKIAFRDVYSKDIAKPLLGGGGSSSKTTVSVDQNLGKARTKVAEIFPDQVQREQFEQGVLELSKYTEEEKLLMADNLRNRSKFYDDNVFEQLDFDVRMSKAREIDLNNQLEVEDKNKNIQLALFDNFDKIESEYYKNLDVIQSYNNLKAKLANDNNKIEEDILKNEEKIAILKKDVTEANKVKTEAAIKALNIENNILNEKKVNNVETVRLNEIEVKSKQTQVDALKEQLKEAELAPDKIKEINDKILQLNKNITTEQYSQSDAERKIWQNKIDMARSYFDEISNLYSGLGDVVQGNMDLTNQEYDAKIWANDEMNISDEKREKNAYKIEMQRYNALKENFELQKKMKVAQAWMDFASGSVGIWSGVNASTGIPGIILSGIQQAALLASTIGNIKTINSQTLEKPHSPGSGGSGQASSSLNVALNPSKTALTSNEENLNMMSKSGDKVSNVVKVSDINKVQNDVKVRENISSY